MAGIKISSLPAAPLSLTTDIAPIVQGATTVKETLAQIITLFNANIQLSSTAQVTGLPSALASFVPLAGGTMTGPLILSGPPTVPFQAVTKAYADAVSGGFTVILATQAATTADLNATPAGAGIGATLTNAGAMAAFAVDGYSASLNDRILVKNQTLTQHNGIYSVTTVGSGAANWVLTRTTDYDTAAQIKPGTLVAVNNGTANANTSWLETATVVTVDTDPVLFSQFTFAPSSFLMVTNNLSDVANAATSRTNLGLTAAATMTLPVSATNGGTGVNNGASTITLGGALSFSGAFTTAFTVTGNTALTLPTSGTLLTNAQPTINQPNIVGVTNNSNAAAGSVGEFVSSVVSAGSSISLVNATAKTVTSISLTTGDWDVQGEVGVAGGATTSITIVAGGISLTNNTFSNPATNASAVQMLTGNGSSWIAGTTGVPYLGLPTCRVSVSTTTNVFLIALANFTVSTLGAYGKITARRVR